MLETPLITLLTDFGYADHYVGTVKGVLLSRCPEARLVDITHGICPFSILEGAYALAQAAPYFPKGTVHLAVVDPGVGTPRRAAVIQSDEQWFVGPDNGLFEMALDGKTWQAREFTRFASHAASKTFHGRDVFAECAAALACGVMTLEEAGPVLESLTSLPGWRERPGENGSSHGTILSVDRYGNIVTSLRSLHHDLKSQRFEITINGQTATAFHETFGLAQDDELFAYHGSSGYIEIGSKQRSAAAALKAVPGQSATLIIRW